MSSDTAGSPAQTKSALSRAYGRSAATSLTRPSRSTTAASSSAVETAASARSMATFDSDHKFLRVGLRFGDDDNLHGNDPIGGVALTVGSLQFGLNAARSVDGATSHSVSPHLFRSPNTFPQTPRIWMFFVEEAGLAPAFAVTGADLHLLDRSLSAPGRSNNPIGLARSQMRPVH